MCARSKHLSENASLRSRSTVIAFVVFFLCCILLVVGYAVKRRVVGKISDYDQIGGGRYVRPEDVDEMMK